MKKTVTLFFNFDCVEDTQKEDRSRKRAGVGQEVRTGTGKGSGQGETRGAGNQKWG